MGSCTSKTDLRLIKSRSDTSIKNNTKNNLMDIDIDKVPNIIYQNQKIPARVVSVYDGDTITVIYLIEHTPIKTKVRLMGIDTPEIKAAKDKLPEEKQAGIICKDYLSKMLFNRLITLEIIGLDKYGRLLGNVVVDEIDISKLMIRQGYAKPYDGTTKCEWTLDQLNKIISSQK